MAADGLTKSLGPIKHCKFVQMINLVAYPEFEATI